VLAEHITDADLLAQLVIGALLACQRFRLTQPRPISNERLTDMVAAFCAGGIAAEPPRLTTMRQGKR
jgi:hypothetical protein